MEETNKLKCFVASLTAEEMLMNKDGIGDMVYVKAVLQEVQREAALRLNWAILKEYGENKEVKDLVCVDGKKLVADGSTKKGASEKGLSKGHENRQEGRWRGNGLKRVEMGHVKVVLIVS